jgi:hypothetical protein
MRDIPPSRSLNSLGYFPDPLSVQHRVLRNLMARSALTKKRPPKRAALSFGEKTMKKQRPHATRTVTITAKPFEASATLI